MSADSQLATVCETGSVALLAIVKSILDGADIQYIVKGEEIQNLMGLGSMVAGYNVLLGPMEVQVRREDESKARQLLADIHET